MIERCMKCSKGILEPTRNKKEMLCHTCGWTQIQMKFAEYVETKGKLDNIHNVNG